ncbi:MAG: HEAT repeat domain-containing protein [Planctomycetota bacterium]|nr:HEAT repeat domain-containing protein [Planctomycetota bacterium]
MDQPRWRQVLSLAALACAAISGCQGGAPKPGQSESVLDLFAPPSPAEAAAWAVDPFDPDKRQRGLLLLANAPFGGENVYVRLYAVAATDEDAGVRAVAMRALSLHGGPDNVPLIAGQLTDREESELVRREAAHALQRLHNTAAIPALIQAIDPAREEDMDVRARAARALGQYAEPRVVRSLINALNDRRLVVNQNARDSLQVLTGQDFRYNARAWTEWMNSSSDVFALRGEYEYPVFQRDPTIVEFLTPFWSPPNESPAKPVGMPVGSDTAAADPEKGGE